MSDTTYDAAEQPQEVLSAEVTEALAQFQDLPPAQDIGPKGEVMGGAADQYRPIQPGEGPPGPLGLQPQAPPGQPQPPGPPQPPGQPPIEQPPMGPPPEQFPGQPQVPGQPPAPGQPQYYQQPGEQPPAVPPTQDINALLAAEQAKVAMYEQMLRGATAPGVPGQPGMPPGMATPTAQPGMPPLPGQPAAYPQAPIASQPPAPQAPPPAQPTDFLGGRDISDMTSEDFNRAMGEAMAVRENAFMERNMHRTAEVSQAIMAQMVNNTMAYENHLAAPGNEWVRSNQGAFDWELQTVTNMYPHLAHDMSALCNMATQSLRARNPALAQAPHAAPPQTNAPPPQQPHIPRVAPQAQTRIPTGVPQPGGQRAERMSFMEGLTPEGY